MSTSASTSLSTAVNTSHPASTAAASIVTSTGASTFFGMLPTITSVSSGVTFSSNFASPSRASMSYSLFQNIPPVFSWSAPIPVQAVPLDPPPSWPDHRLSA
ncbi:unnamed protein product, partial [Cuscuta europaea]